MSVNYKKIWKLMIDKNLSKTELTHLAGISTNAIKMLCPGWGKLAKAAATSPSLI